MGLTRRQIESHYREGIFRLDGQWHYLKTEFGEKVAREIYQAKADRILETYYSRLRDNKIAP